MNPLTNIKNIQKLSQRELELGVNIKNSWHQQYKDSAWVFIGGLSYDLTEGDVICVFSQYGEIININLVRDKKTGKSKGFAFLCYEDQHSTILAVDNLNGMKLTQRTIRVDHVEEYKVPKMDEDMDETQKKLALEGVAPKPLQPPSSDKESDDGLNIKIPPPTTDKTKNKKLKKVKVKKEKKEKKSKKKKRKYSTSSESSSSSSSSDSSSSSESDYERKKRKYKKKKAKRKPEVYDSDEDHISTEIKKEKIDLGYKKYENPNVDDRWQHDKYREDDRGSYRDRKIKTEFDTDDNIRDQSRRNENNYRKDQNRDRHRSRSRERKKHRSRSRERQKDRSRERQKDRSRERQKNRNRDEDRDKYRSRSIERHKERYKDRR